MLKYIDGEEKERDGEEERVFFLQRAAHSCAPLEAKAISSFVPKIKVIHESIRGDSLAGWSLEPASRFIRDNKCKMYR